MDVNDGLPLNKLWTSRNVQIHLKVDIQLEMLKNEVDQIQADVEYNFD